MQLLLTYFGIKHFCPQPESMVAPVSYTHLDVYKRQHSGCSEWLLADLAYILPVVHGATSVQCCPTYCSYAPDHFLGWSRSRLLRLSSYLR